MSEIIQRMLVGDAPWSFAAEVIVRALSIYVVLMVIMRLMGKRIVAQLSRGELAVVLMLGAAIGVPIQVATQGILPAVVVLATVALMQRGLSWVCARRRAFEKVVYGEIAILIEDGVMNLDIVAAMQISPDMLMSQLRALGVRQLGELRRAYMETSGQVSLVHYARPRPGLSTAAVLKDPYLAAAAVEDERACMRCGYTKRSALTGHCPRCRGNDWQCAALARST